MGEYNTFTRIVFELDKAPTAPPEISTHSEELRVIFSDIKADLVRKIPLRRIHHVQAIQVWLEANKLSAVFKVDAPYTHGEIRSISNPPRVIVDIHWQAVNQRSPASQTISQQPIPAEASASSIESMATPSPAELSGHARLAPSAAEEEPSEATLTEVALPRSDNHPHEVGLLTPPEAPVQAPSGQAPGTTANAAAFKSNQWSGWLQYYLVIGLVILTIIILLILVVMLLTRYRWVNDRLLFNANEQLRQQQAKVASINERIKEQLKDLEKA